MQFSCSVTKSCLTLWDPMNCSKPGFPGFMISQNLLKFMSIESMMLCSHLILCLLLRPSIFPRIRVFSKELALHIRWPKYWTFCSSSVLPVNIQGWNPLGVTGNTCQIPVPSTPSWRRQWHPTPVLLLGKIPWMEEPGRLQSMGSLWVRHDWVTSLSLFTFTHWRRKWQPTPVFLPGESQGRRSLVGCCLWGHTELNTTEVT